MKYLVSVAFIVFLFSCNSSDTASRNSGDESEASTTATKEDWVSLYNGKNFAGWHVYGKDSVSSAWQAEDSIIHLKPLRRSGWQSQNGGDLVTDEEYSSFDLKLDWKISTAGNSGVFIYVHEDPTKFKNPNQSGLEMQINDNDNNKHGLIVKQKCGDLAELLSSSSEKVVKPAGQWNQVEIRSDHGKLDFFLNGKHTLSTTLWDDNWEELINNSRFKDTEDFGTYRKGKIALQDHGEDVWFRNIMIKKL